MNKDNEIILVVDDNSNNLKLLKDILTKANYRVHLAINGKKALSSIEIEKPNLILLDIKMPELNGYEVCEILMANTETNDIPVIFISAVKETIDIVKAFEIGAVDYITKPFASEEVLARVSTHLTINKLNKKLENYNKTLERQVRERTKELTQVNEKLRFAIDEIRTSNQLKTEFIHTISHELRTPLNGILGFAHLLMESEYDHHDAKFYVQYIMQSGKRLLNIIQDLLDVSKLEKGILSIQQENVFLKDIHQIIEQECKIKAINKNLLFNIEVADNVPSCIVTDGTRFVQVLLNLVDNAIKFTLQGSVSLCINADSGKLNCIVKDTGIGISNDNIYNIFDYFFQVESTDTRQFEGSGIGLFISNKIASLLHGTIKVSSELGKGSQFVFQIPLKIANVSQEKIEDYEEESDKTNQPISILIVDDDPIALALVENILINKLPNLRILTANNGRQAIEILKQEIVDLIIMDIRMPILDGYEATRIIKSDPNLNNIPIIIMTAYASMEDKKRLLKSGGDDFITKPINNRELYNTIIKIFASTRHF